MNAHHKLAGASVAPAGAPATFSLTTILESARKYERATTDEGELSFLLNVVDQLLLARPGLYADECLKDFKSSLENALENEAEDRRWNGAERVEL